MSKYIEEAIVSDAPEELMAQIGPIVEETAVSPKLVRPKRPSRIASSAISYPGYDILKDLTGSDGGRHFLFAMKKGDQIIQHVVNVDPYFGYVLSDPKDFYYKLRDSVKLEMKRAGRSYPDYGMARRLIENKYPEKKKKEEEPIKKEAPKKKEHVQLELGLDIPVRRVHPDAADWSMASGWMEQFLKSADSVWTQSQVYCEDGKCYDVEKMIDITANNNLARAKIESLATQLESNAWGDDAMHLSPMDVLRNPVLNVNHKIHMRRIQTANMQYPILIRFKDGKIIDGYHRLARALKAGDKYIDAIFIQDEQFDRAEVKS